MSDLSGLLKRKFELSYDLLCEICENMGEGLPSRLTGGPYKRLLEKDLNFLFRFISRSDDKEVRERVEVLKGEMKGKVNSGDISEIVH